MMRKKAMLAHNVGGFERITDENWDNGLYIQPKLDGVRCLIQAEFTDVFKVLEVKAYSRTNKEWKNINHILIELIPFFDKYPNAILDGELYNHDLSDDFEKIISLVRKTKPTDEDRYEASQKVQFHCYDIIDEDMTFEQRDEFIKLNFPFSESLKMVTTHWVESENEAKKYHKRNLQDGYEGSIVRTNDTYQCKRSHNLRKFKDFHDAEATITGWVEGKGKRIGTIGKFTAIDEEGNEFGMPVMDKFEYLQENFEEMKTWVGQLATFKYFERTKANSYRHPLFKAIRNYE